MPVLHKQIRKKSQATIDKMRKPYCELCGARAHGEPHHVVTRGKGGPDISENLIQLCGRCHYELLPAAKISRDTLLKIIAFREGKSIEEIKAIIKQYVSVNLDR